MASKTRALLKALFQTGRTMPQSSFEDLIDSALNLSETSTQTMAGQLTVPTLSVTGTTTVVGGTITGLTNLVSTNATITTLASSAAAITGGTISGVSTASFTDATATTGHVTTLNCLAPVKYKSSGADAVVGTATLSSGVATINTTAIATGDHVLLTYNGTPSSSPGVLVRGTITNGVSFVVNSINPATGLLNSSDGSAFSWLIVKGGAS